MLNRAVQYYRENGLVALSNAAVNKARADIKYYSSFLYSPTPMDLSCRQLSHRRLNNLQEGDSSLEDIRQTAMQFSGLGHYQDITPIQKPDEIRELMELVVAHDPNTIMEIGTDRGGTLYLWSQLPVDVDQVISLDLDYNTLDWSGKYWQNRQVFYERFSDDTEITCLELNSHQQSSVDTVEDIANNSIDFLFIDADHSYDGVKQDFELYQPIMSNDGLVALHDINNNRCGVPKFWDEIVDEYQTTEIVCGLEEGIKAPHISQDRLNLMKNGGGIGVVHLNDNC